MLPGEVEEVTRQERTANGIPIDGQTFAQIQAAGKSMGAVPPEPWHPS